MVAWQKSRGSRKLYYPSLHATETGIRPLGSCRLFKCTFNLFSTQHLILSVLNSGTSSP